MKSLLLLLISAVLAMVLIKCVPFGLTRKEKIIVTVSSFLIGTFGWIFSLITAPLHALLIMILLAFSVGYSMVSHSVVFAPVKGPVRLMVNDRLSWNSIEIDIPPETPTKESSMSITQADEIVPKVFPNHQEMGLEDDISFLEERNKLPLTDFDDIPIINFDNKKDLKDDKWIREVEEQEMYATSQS
jgi:hypothetical protein